MRAYQLGSTLCTTLLLGSLFMPTGLTEPTPAMKNVPKVTASRGVKQYKPVEVKDLLNAPTKFLKQGITIQGVFSSFSDLGLDYPKVMRSSRDYLSLIIFRPDVTHHQIPLSELKLIAPRKLSTSLEKLGLGDEIKIYGRVSADALGEPWIDVDKVEILKKAPEKKAAN